MKVAYDGEYLEFNIAPGPTLAQRWAKLGQKYASRRWDALPRDFRSDAAYIAQATPDDGTLVKAQALAR